MGNFIGSWILWGSLRDLGWIMGSFIGSEFDDGELYRIQRGLYGGINRI